MSRNVTFRVRRVPAEVSLDGLAAFLHWSVEGLGDLSNINVRSLAATPDDWREPPQQVATVDFDNVPSRFSGAGQNEWFVKLTNSSVRLVFDTHFLGFTPLSAPGIDKHTVDCVAISGLASHPFGSWRRRDKTDTYQFMWLRDQLALDFPAWRVLSYGYNTTLQDTESSQSIDDLARAFIGLLFTVGLAEYSARPLVFLAHSLGGLVLKTALRYLARGDEAEQQILGNLRLIVFFGVPHRGMHIRHLQTIVNDRPNQSLISMLSTNSDFLPLLEEVFSGILTHRPIRLISAYETVRSRVAELQPSGKLERTGSAELLVGRESAIHPNSKVPSDLLSIDRDHSKIVKFGPDDHAYLILRKIISSTFPQQSEQAERKGDGIQDKLPESLRPRIIEAIPRGGRQHSTMHPDHSEPSGDARRDINLVLDSLAFEEEDYRLRAIEPAHQATCAWIFENRHLGFVEWVLHGEGIYWIRGKPGSGKSTLFRYLHDNRQFHEMLSSRSLMIEQVSVWHFFNERGTYLQKSLEGLLRGLLRRIASSNGTFADLIMDLYYAKPRNMQGRWTMEDIKSAFAAVLVQDVADVDLMIFLDALDEYSGFPETIVRWIQDCLTRCQALRSKTTLRFCISSREYGAFVREFADAAGFALHRQTMRDIEEYLHNRLSDLLSLNEGVRWTSQISPNAVVDILAERAQGVFLWVKLALDELDRLPRDAGAAEVRSLIDGLPVDLNEFYERTLSRIPLHARSRAYALLELVHKSANLLTLEAILEAEACASGPTFESCQGLLLRHQQHMTGVSNEPLPALLYASNQHIVGDFRQEIQAPEAETGQLLLDLCGGLLECVSTARSNSRSGSEIFGPSRRQQYVDLYQACRDQQYVQFIHRTVRDFVGKSGFSALMLGGRHLLQTENGYSFLLKYHCVNYPCHGNPDDELSRLALAHEKTTGRDSAEFLDSLPLSFFEVPDRERIYASAGHTSHFLLGAVAGLQLYIQPYLHPDRIRETRTANPRVINVLAWDVSRRSRDRRSPEEPELKVPDNGTCGDSDMLKTLLGHGFSSTDVLFGFSPFETIFCRAHSGSGVPGESAYTPEMIQFAETLIQYAGQDPNVLLHSRDCKYSSLDRSLRWGMVVHRERCAVHVSYGGMMAMLLRNGANPNVQDSKGNTALDVCIGTERNVFDFGFPWSSKAVYPMTMILLDHGAKLTSRGALLRPVLIKIMGQHDPSLDWSRLEDVEVLNLPVHTSDIRSYEYFLTDHRSGRQTFLRTPATLK